MADFGALLQGLVNGFQSERAYIDQRKNMEIQREISQAQAKVLKHQIDKQDLMDQMLANMPPLARMAIQSDKPLEMAAAMEYLGGGGFGQPQGMPGGAGPEPYAPPMLPQGPGGMQTGMQAPELPSLVDYMSGAAFPAPQAPAPAAGVSYSTPVNLQPGGGGAMNNPILMAKLGVKAEAQTQYDPATGRLEKYMWNPLTKSEIPGTRTLVDIKTPDNVITEDVTFGGKKYKQDIDKITRQPIGEPRPVEFGTASVDPTIANNLTMSKNALRNLQSAVNALYEGGDPSKMDLVFAKFGVPGTKGKDFAEAWASVLPVYSQILKGSGNNEQQVEAKTAAVTPGADDGPEEIRRKFENMVSIMSDKLKLMDPEGKYGAVSVTLPWKNASKVDLYKRYNLTPKK